MRDFKGYTNVFYHAQCNGTMCFSARLRQMSEKPTQNTTNRKYSTLLLDIRLHTFGSNVGTLTLAYSRKTNVITKFRVDCLLSFDVDHYQAASAYVVWIGRTRKCGYSCWNCINMLFLMEGFTISGLRRHLGFSYVGP